MTVTPHQHTLPIAGVRTAKPNRAVAPAPTDYRPIHVSTYGRKGRDYDATPAWVTEALLRHVRFRGPIWEPCCGAGAISTVLVAYGYEVLSTDIADSGFGTPGVDFFACRSAPPGCRSIITNSPYGEAATHEGQSRSSRAMLEFSSPTLALTTAVESQLALLVCLQWIAGKRVADVMTAAPQWTVAAQ